MTKEEQVADFIEKGKNTQFKAGEKQVEIARQAGIKSGEVRREKAALKRDAKAAARYVLECGASDTDIDNMKRLNAKEEDGLTYMEVAMARLLVMWMGGNLEAGKMLMEYAGYDSKENRTERESLNADRRRDAEMEAKLKKLDATPEIAGMSINMGDEDGNEDVVFYIPQMLNEEDCKANDDKAAEEDAENEK